jgi:hypothetical protein
MITSALRTGYPLPQITPCLLDRSMSVYHGFDVIQKEEEEDYGLPRTLNLETLQNEQYLYVRHYGPDSDTLMDINCC